jgi:peptide/nickel transport system permease protein
LALSVVTLLVVSILIFAATQALPGDVARSILGREATPSALAALRAHLHLDESVFSQYLRWIGGVLHGDPGRSLASGQSVTQLVDHPLLNTTILVVVAALVAIPLSLGLGILTAVKRDGLTDHVVSTGNLILAALPEFVIGIALVLLFATAVFNWLPPVDLFDPSSTVLSQPKDLVLPAATLVLAVMPYISRIMRASTIDVLESEYVEMARLKGMPSRRVLLRHAVPNALVPAIQVSALQMAWMAGGVVTVEFVFSYPGVGSLLVRSVGARDIVVVQAITLAVAVVYVALNLVADLLSIMLTPKMRTGMR